jgi:hypothetical protein
MRNWGRAAGAPTGPSSCAGPSTSARFLYEVTANQPLKDIPWDRPTGVKTNDTGGSLRTTMEEVKAEASEPHKKKKKEKDLMSASGFNLTS